MDSVRSVCDSQPLSIRMICAMMSKRGIALVVICSKASAIIIYGELLIGPKACA